MREIKFRAWNKVYKKYVEINELEMGVKSLAIKFITPSGRTLYLEHGNSIILEQYTGLKDKNGVEIYEGDIVKMDGLYYLIKWDDEGGKWCMSLERDWMDYLFLTKKKAPFMEIIGNIHENGDLIR